MKSKKIHFICLCLTVCCCCTFSLSGKPNVVLVLLDDVGTGWIPPYAETLDAEDLDATIVQAYKEGRNGKKEIDVDKHIEAARNCMPFLDRLADEGLVFHRAFATSNLCAPSRAGLLSGSFPQQWGAYRNSDIDDYGIPLDRRLISDVFQGAGYACGMVGKWHVGPKDQDLKKKIASEKDGSGGGMQDRLRNAGYSSSTEKGFHPLDRGFDYYFGFNSHGDKYYESETLWEGRERVAKRPKGEFLTNLLNGKAIEFAQSAMTEGKPFFLYYAPKTLHGGILPPPERYSSQFDTGVAFSDGYAGHLLALDEGIEKLYAAIEAQGQLENTLFVFSSDNGCTRYNVPPHNAPNRGGKGTGWLGGSNVPLIIHKPGTVVAGESNAVVSLADLMPTVLEAAGLSSPSGIDGKSLLSLLSGQDDKVRTSLTLSGLHSSGWSWFYEGNGEVNKKDRVDAAMFASTIGENDKVLLQLSEIPAGLYETLPDGVPARSLFFDLATDRQQLKDVSRNYPEESERLNGETHRWLEQMKPPMTSQVDDYEYLLEVTKNR